MQFQECQDCGYMVCICEGVKPFNVCPECDGTNIEVKE